MAIWLSSGCLERAEHITAQGKRQKGKPRSGKDHTSLKSPEGRYIVENSGDGKLIHKVIQQLPQGTQILQADINRDGRMDLPGTYHGNQGSELFTLTQTKSFSFSQDVQFLPFFGSTMCVGDLDGVNCPDLVIGDDTNSIVHIYWNDGAGSFFLQGNYNTEATFRDVDGDGIHDEQVPVYPLSCKCCGLWPEKLSVRIALRACALV